MQGKVLEVGTGNPIPDAIVIVRWTGSVSSLADSHGVCVYVDTARTDTQGRFRFSGWVKRSEAGPVTEIGPVLSAYKSGYVQPRFADGNVIQLERFGGGTQERFEYLRSISYSARCAGAGESYKNLLAFFRAIYDEAKSAAVTSADHRIADELLSNIESVELGEKAATERAIERAEKRDQQ